MGKAIFINYRRKDELGFADSIYQRLVKEFGDDQVFRDQDGIPAGHDFERVLNEQVEACDVLVAVVGPKWLEIAGPDGTRRLDDVEHGHDAGWLSDPDGLWRYDSGVRGEYIANMGY